MRTTRQLGIRDRAPTELLAYYALVSSWPPDVLRQIENELGADECYQLSAREIDRMVSMRHAKQ